MDKELEIFGQIAKALFEAEEKQPIAPALDIETLLSQLDVRLGDRGMDDEQLANLLKEIVLATPRTASTSFFNQLFGGRQAKGTLGELLTVLLNNSMYTYKVGGPMVAIEKEMINHVKNMVGYTDGDGTMAPGGSMTILMAMIMARDAKDLTIRTEGVRQQMTLYTSKESHYSVPKNASFIGVGRGQVRFVPADDFGRMDATVLEEMIVRDKADGKVPFFINSTMGTTVLGAFDPLDEIAVIAKKHDVWLHVDGAYCGSVIFSDTKKHLCKGVALSDSFSFNAHKMLGVPLSASFIVTKHTQSLYDSFANKADYLYQMDNDYYNPGKISMQCGRRNDALKFWTLWKSIGTKGLGDMVDHQFGLAAYALDYIRKHPDYEVYSYDDSVNVCFNYKNVSPEELCTYLYQESMLMVGYGQFREDVFVRLAIVNANNTTKEMDEFFAMIEKAGDQLS